MRDFHAMPDEELWSLTASHNGDAFGELFERHADAVYNHCFRRTGSWSVAEDLTSVVFLEAWRRRRQVQFRGQSFLPWLLGVANNAVRNSDRSIRRYRRLLAKLPRPAAIPDQSDEAIGRIDDERVMREILHVFNRLSSQDQDIVSVCDWSGLSYQEAALALGIPVGTVRSRLSRARSRLRDQLGQGAGSPNRRDSTSSGEEQ